MRRVIVFLLLIVAATVFAAPKVKVDVAIVGGGSAGRYLAVRAKDLGLTTATFEKSSRTGGHCDPVLNPDGQTYAQMGVDNLLDTALANAAIGAGFTIDSRAYIERFVDPSHLENVGYTASTNVQYLFDARTSFLFPAPAGAAAQQVATGAALVELFGIVSQQYPWTLTGPMPEQVDRELSVPFAYWMVQKNLTALYLSVFEVLLTISGYGSIDQISAFEALRALPKCDLALFFPNTPLQLDLSNGGCGDLYAGIDTFVAGNDRLFLNTEVISVHREDGDDYMVVDYRQVDAPQKPKQSLLARRLVIAVPPTLENVGFLDFNTTDNGTIADPLYDLLAGVRTRTYVGFAVSAQLGPMINTSRGFTVLNLNINLAVQPPSITYPALPAVVALKRDDTSGLIGGWFVSDNASITDDEVLATIRAQLAKLPGYFLSNITVAAVARHHYAPYFSQLFSAPVNPYYTLDQLQGQGNVYLAGALRAGANSPLIWQHAEGLIQQIRASIAVVAA